MGTRDLGLSARSREINSRSGEPQFNMGRTRNVGTQRVWLWEGIVRGIPLEWWRVDAWNPDMIVIRLTDVLSVAVLFNDRIAHSELRSVHPL